MSCRGLPQLLFFACIEGVGSLSHRGSQGLQLACVKLPGLERFHLLKESFATLSRLPVGWIPYDHIRVSLHWRQKWTLLVLLNLPQDLLFKVTCGRCVAVEVNQERFLEGARGYG